MSFLKNIANFYDIDNPSVFDYFILLLMSFTILLVAGYVIGVVITSL